MTLSIVDFLRERIQEDEDATKAVSTPYRLYIYDDGQVREPEIEDRADSDDYGSYRRDFDGNDVLPNRHCGYALIFDPARVLREVAAKRALVEDHDDQHECATGRPYDFPYIGCNVLRYMAAVHSGHPDYRPEWQPII
jgi:hypothetical protein